VDLVLGKDNNLFFMKKDNATITVSNILWRLFERIGVQGISFIVSIILARMLDPSDYGLLAIVTIFITLANVVIDSGFGVALIQKDNTDSLDYSTVFYFNILLCLIIYFILYFSAPFISVYYHTNQLVNVIRVIGTIVLLAPIKNVQYAYISKNFLFKKFFFSTIIGTLVSAIVGIYLAYAGKGVWALVFQQLTNAVIDMVVLWFTVKWRPKLEFSIDRLGGLFGFGSKLFVSSIIHTIYDNLRQLIIGRVYSSEDLAFYSKGKQIPNLFMTNLNIAIESVLFPTFVERKNNILELKEAVQKYIRVLSFIIWPIMLGVSAIAEPLIKILLTEKWLFCVPYLKVFCICYAFQPIHTANLCAIKAIGRSDIFLKIEVIKKIVGIIIIIVAIKYGVYAIAISSIIYNVFAQLVNTFPNKGLLGYGYLEQIKDIFPFALFSLVMFAVLRTFNIIVANAYILIVMKVVVGVIFYVLCCFFFERDIVKYVYSIFINMKKR